jgi:lipopolysaccharide transport system ATP-binding protein
MSDIAIKVEALGKQYRIGKQERYRTLRDTLTDAISAPFRGIRSVFGGGPARKEPQVETIWALKDVSFEIPRGEVVGIIGRNGAGKSTLLKVLSRITEPTEGYAEIRGRVGSLLEVGTGFHPELTGRENISLNGAILGMRKAEIARKFDEIVAFAEVEKFIDTPVKHYSSGMYMRLAFAVAAHLEPEILIVDEVLAVGDAAFQKKCLGKMGDVAKQGRTVLLVSHNLIAIENLCTQALYLDSGMLREAGNTRDVINTYFSSQGDARKKELGTTTDRSGSGEVRFTAVEVLRRDERIGKAIRAGDDILIRMQFSCAAKISRAVFAVSIFSSKGTPVFAVHTTDLAYAVPDLNESGQIELAIDKPNLLPGRYLVHVAAGDETSPLRYDHVPEAAVLDIEPSDVYGTGRLTGTNWSLIFLDCEWKLSSQENHLLFANNER